MNKSHINSDRVGICQRRGLVGWQETQTISAAASPPVASEDEDGSVMILWRDNNFLDSESSASHVVLI